MRSAIICTAFFLLASCSASADVTTIQGENFDMAKATKGSPAIINFWASWCAFCATELPAFDAFARMHPDVAVIGVNLQEKAETARNYWEKGGYSFPAILDPDAVLKKRYDVFTQPTTIFLDAEGNVVERRDGPLTQEELFDFASRITETKTLQPLQEAQIYSSPTPPLLKRWSDRYGDTITHSMDLDDILSGGVPKDGIPALDNPQFVSVQEAQKFLTEEDTGTVYMAGETIRFYPFTILNWHEIVNDTVEDVPIMVTYCPLCDSAAVYDRTTSNGVSTFGVSGFLQQSNLMMYDRKTDSLWNQILGKAVVGELTGKELTLLPSNVIRFSTLRKEYPQAQVLSTDTGYARDYDRNPYKGYAKIDDIMFPVGVQDVRLAPKERILGIVVEDTAKAYPRTALEGTNTIRDHIGKNTVTVTWDPAREKAVFIVNGKQMEPIHTFWFSWVAQHHETEVYGE